MAERRLGGGATTTLMAAGEEKSGNPLWDTWVDALQAAAAPVSLYGDFLERWRAAAVPAAAPAADESAPTGAPQTSTASGFLQTFLSGQQALLRMMERAAEAMRAAGPTKAESGTTVDDGVTRFINALRDLRAANPLLSGFDSVIAGAAQYQQLSGPWTELLGRSLGGVMSGPGAAGDPLGDALERSFGLLADFPGLNTELPTLLQSASSSWMALQAAREAYQQIMAATWQRAFSEISRELLERAAGKTPVDTPGALLSLSTSVADRVFVETFRTERYIEAQRNLSTSLASHRECEAKVVDLLARSGHFPTRREHDEALREINMLRRDVHALKREVRLLHARANPAQSGGATGGSETEQRNGSTAHGGGNVRTSATPPPAPVAAEPGAVSPTSKAPNGKAERRRKGLQKKRNNGK